MFNDQLSSIENQKNKAFGIFNKVLADLKSTAEKANGFITKNIIEVDSKKQEIETLETKNNELYSHISQINAQIGKIEAIIN